MCLGNRFFPLNLLTRPTARPSHKPVVLYKGFLYPATRWKTARRYCDSGIPCRGSCSPREVCRYQSADAEPGGGALLQHTRDSRTIDKRRQAGSEDDPTLMSPFPLQQSAAGAEPGGLNLGNLWRRLALPRPIEKYSLTSLQQRVVKTGGRLVKHARYYWLLLAKEHLKRRHNMEQFAMRMKRLGHSGSKFFHTMRGGGTMVCFLPLLRLKRRFQKKLSLQGRMQCCQTGFSTQKRRNGRSSLSRTRKRLHR